MAITNRERVGKAMDLLKEGLGPFVEREFQSLHGPREGLTRARGYFYDDSRLSTDGPLTDWDSAALRPETGRETVRDLVRFIESIGVS